MNTLVSIAATILTAALTSLFAFWIQERKLRAELRTEFMAEAAVKRLLSSPQWKKRSFDKIKIRIGGFTDDELRRILVRAGAVCFTGANNEEFWGLIERNGDDIV